MKDTMKNREKVGSREKAELARLKKSTNENKFFLIVIFIIFIIAAILIVITAWNMGDMWGTFAGKANGSYNGITEGLGKGYEAGREEGLSAKDTEVDIASKIKEIGKLEVLSIDDQILNVFELGDAYKALFAYKGIATFSIDFSKVEINDEGSTVEIVLPTPEVEFSIDENETKKMAEWQKFFWSGDAEAGYDAYMNSMVEIKNKTADELENYAEWERLAKESAEKQVEMLVRSASSKEKEIHIYFGEEP